MTGDFFPKNCARDCRIGAIDNPDETLKYSSEDFHLPVGEKIRIEISHGDQHIVSPTYEP